MVMRLSGRVSGLLDELSEAVSMLQVSCVALHLLFGRSTAELEAITD